MLEVSGGGWTRDEAAAKPATTVSEMVSLSVLVVSVSALVSPSVLASLSARVSPSALASLSACAFAHQPPANEAWLRQVTWH